MPHEFLSDQELAELEWAHRHLENVSFAARMYGLIGTPIDNGIKMLPARWSRFVFDAADYSIGNILDVVVEKAHFPPPGWVGDRGHRFLVVGTGALGGFFGPLGLVAELPFTTAIMLRSIADIARVQGEDLSSPESRLACVEVFGLGGRTQEDNAADLGYYGVRVSLGRHLTGVLAASGTPGAASIPSSIRLIQSVAARFGVTLTDHAAVRLIPVAGAVGAAALNLMFMRHYQDVARGHFTVRRLERRYGSEPIRREFKRLSREAERRSDFSPVEGW